jgi:ribonuclease BN (tRNA processing enzyme)
VKGKTMKILKSILLSTLVLGSLVCQAQSSTSTPSTLIMLGTGGGPLPRAHRAQTSHAFVVNGQPYLIDAGDGMTRRVAQAGLNFTKVNQIFITHLHNDHMAGLATFLDTSWQYSRRTALNVYGPMGTEATVKGAIQYMSIEAEIRGISEGKNVPLATVFKGNDVKEGVIFQDANIKVTATQNSHYQFSAEDAKRHQSFAYRFESKDKCVVFTGDTGPSANVEKLAQGCDILVAEVGQVEDVIALQEKNGTWQMKTQDEKTSWIKHMVEEHMTPKQVGELAQRAGVKLLILSHLLPSSDPNDTYERFKVEASKFYKGEVVVAKDLMKF